MIKIIRFTILQHVFKLIITAYVAYFKSLTETTSPVPLFDVARVFLPNCRSLSKQDDSASLGMPWGWIPHSTLTEPSEHQFVDCREIGSVPLVAHDTPGFVLWKQTCCLSTLAWMLHGDLLRIEHAWGSWGTSWRLLRSSQGHAPIDDDDDDDDSNYRPSARAHASRRPRYLPIRSASIARCWMLFPKSLPYQLDLSSTSILMGALGHTLTPFRTFRPVFAEASAESLFVRRGCLSDPRW